MTAMDLPGCSFPAFHLLCCFVGDIYGLIDQVSEKDGLFDFDSFGNINQVSGSDLA